MKVKVLIFFIAMITGFLAGWFLKNNKGKIKIVTETKTEFKYLKEAKSGQDFMDCYKKPLDIFAKVNNDNCIEITATDTCKLAKKRIQISPIYKKNYVFINFGIEEIQVMYYRRLDNILIGFGVGYPKNAYISSGITF